MDLSLRGSQINLAERYKTKVPATKIAGNCNQRPVSATYTLNRRTKSEHTIKRPLSADERLKKYSSASSSSLLKFLLEEPVRRPWLCRNSPENSQNLKTLRQRTYRISEDKVVSNLRAIPNEKMQSNSGSFNYKGYKSTSTLSEGQSQLPNISNDDLNGSSHKQLPGTLNKSKSSPGDFWHDTKPDLPGRVSFGKSDIYEVDLSDIENETPPDITARSTESHVIPPANINSQSASVAQLPSSSLVGNKKAVHFGGKNGEVQSQTFEYPKCPSDNCSCSNRSSISTVSALEPSDNDNSHNNCVKCTCDFACNSMDYTNLASTKVQEPIKNDDVTNDTENSVIKEYKNAIKDVENVGKEQKIFKIDKPEPSKNEELVTAYSNHDLNKEQENQVYKSESKLTQPRRKASTSSNSKFLKSYDAFFVNNFEERDINESRSDILSSEDNTKLAGTTQNMTAPKKKVNNSSTSNVGGNNVRQQHSAPSKRSSKAVKNRRSKSASLTSSESSNHTKMKKSGTYSCLREDSILDEFQLDKVDSWMSMQQNRRGDGDHLGDTEEEIFDSNGSPETSETLKSEENSQDGSTYDEIVSVIKEIEEEKKKHDEYNSKKYMDNINSKDVNFMKLQALLESQGVNSNSHTESTQTSGNGSPESSDKLKDILEYLEDVENDCDRTLLETRRSIPETNRTEIEFSIEPDIAEDVPKLADLLMLPNHQLARRIISLSLRANELANGIQLAKQHVEHIRQEKQKSLRVEKQNTSKRIEEQKKHFESIISRHQTFIEQLLKDKGVLCEKVTALTRRMDSQNQAWEHKLETEVARATETTLAGEKIRRERWVRENTKKIKELTVKGLESEINRMQLNHQHEIIEMKRQHQQQLLDSLEEARLKHEQNANAIRDTLAQDREMLIEKERTTIRERFEKQLEEERKSFDEQKTKLIEGFTFERDQIQAEYRQKESEFLTRKQELLDEKDAEIQRVIAEFQEKLVQQEQKYQTRINAIEKQFESDFIIWKREYENSCKLKEVENENTIRQHYRTERDRQIDAIVSRMDAESQKCQEEFELKLSRLKEKYDNDMKEAESVEKSLRDKYNETRSRLAESEAMAQNFQAEIKQLQMELEHSKKMNDDFLEMKEKVKENARNDVLTEIANIKTERDNEIQKIYKRVQQAIEKKDSTVELLQKENGTLRERCVKLEAVIRQQRKDYCIK
ncbi:centrosomal protein of 131 kDa [Condylostylus longicornis]|uniref:centrosomal protein of 131 kDa n=1 Tax=Condylostylus longicornis TaxID=2530218 RepID=UPI00244E52CD|nr:centrosomal protein of 131 kDa [Condylostylus longicornis]